MKQIPLQSRVIKTEPIFWRKLQFIQEDNFKELASEAYESLKTSILSNNFAQPFYVWQDPIGPLFCLDGRHRVLVLERLIDEGFNVPEELPGTFIVCQDKKDAAKLVLIYSSIYAKITHQGLFDFIQMYDLDYDQLRTQMEIPELSMDRFEQKFDLFGIADIEAPEEDIIQEEVIIQEGDLFELNGHRLLCASFKDQSAVTDLMAGKGARIVNCDPPYNLPVDFFLTNNKTTHQHEDFAMASGEMSDTEFVEFLAMVMRASVENTVPGAIHYIFMDFRHSWHMCEAARQVYGSPVPKQQITWYKDHMANGGFYRPQKELCFIFTDGTAKFHWNNDLLDEGGFYKSNDELCFIFKNGDGAKHLSHLEMRDRIRTNVWRYPSGASRANPDHALTKDHPTPKPVAMIADAILDTTNPGEIVIDWFLGSGTCLLACEQTKRLCYATEIDPKYIQLAIKRYAHYCDRNRIDINFSHLNGNLTLKSFINEPVNHE